MKCPHCLHAIHSAEKTVFSELDVDGHWRIQVQVCPHCSRFVMALEKITVFQNGAVRDTISRTYFRPRSSSRPQADASVISPYRDDYHEACAVIADSAKASAALTRRCLQAVLRDKGGFAQKDLADQISAALSEGKLPSHITESLDAVRQIGNFAAHPQKSKASGELLDVEPGEAEWNIETIEALFDYYFVQPALIQKKRSALEEKLKAAGKPPLK
jgi:hypothetical protein